MRTKGFIAPTNEQWNDYAYKNGNDHKNLYLRLHPFIVECSISPKEDINDDEYVNKVWLRINKDYENNKDLDDLDRAMIKRYQKFINVRMNEDYENNNDLKDNDTVMLKIYQNQKNDKKELSDEDKKNIRNCIRENWDAKKYDEPDADKDIMKELEKIKLEKSKE